MTETLRLEMARNLVSELEQGHSERADEVLRQLVRDFEAGLFHEVGKLTRELHDTLRDMERDSSLAAIATTEIPDAKVRLQYVIDKTEAAAHKTLTAVEEMIPVAERMGRDFGELQEEWTRFTSRQMELGDFKHLSKRIGSFLEQSREGVQSLQDNLTVVLMAQDYQDLTGQVIRRVISLVQNVEEKLVTLVRVTGGRGDRPAMPAANDVTAEGPRIGTEADPKFAANQDEVDDLLSSLGF